MCRPDLIAKSSLEAIQGIFADEKLAKQILSAAKRVAKKRSAAEAGPPAEEEEDDSSPARKRKKPTSSSSSSLFAEATAPAATEESLALPSVVATDEELARTILHTNRAPLMLAFAVTLLQHTMAEQPLSSRLSLAQAVVTANSRSKAAHLGITDKGTMGAEEEEGWGAGQPRVRVMGREICVLKRWAYDHDEWKVVDPEEESLGAKKTGPPPPLWALALRSSSSSANTNTNTLPIHTPQSARSYLLKAFACPPPTPPPQKQQQQHEEKEKARNLGLLLLALERLFASWQHVLSAEELDRRSWAWYVAVRPDVAAGVAGWGGRGEVKLGEILALRR